MIASHESNQLRPRVEPPYLVTPSRIALPQRCIVTNEPVSDSEYQLWDLPCLPRWLIALMFLGPFFLLSAPYVRQRCKLKAGVSRRVRRKRLFIKALLIAMAASPLAGMAATVLTRSPAWSVLTAISIVLACPALAILVVYAGPMRVHKFKGDYCWVSGCSPEFLASLQEPEPRYNS